MLAELAAVADRGFTVSVELPERAPELGWRVTVDGPGRHMSFRVPTNAGPAEWAKAVAGVFEIGRAMVGRKPRAR